MEYAKVSVAWECRECGKRRLWRWSMPDVCTDSPIFMVCGKRCEDTKGKLVRIGDEAYALAWQEWSL